MAGSDGISTNNFCCHCYSTVISKTCDTERVPKHTGGDFRGAGLAMTKGSVEDLLFVCQSALTI